MRTPSTSTWRRIIVAIISIATLSLGTGVLDARASSSPTLGQVLVEPPTSTSVVIQTSVNPNGSPTAVVVDYGTSSSYGQTSAVQNVGSASSLLGVAFQLTGLSPATTYHLRVVATNAAGSASSSDRTFTTAGAGGSSSTTTVPSGPSLPRANENLVAVPLNGFGGQSSALLSASCHGVTCVAVGLIVQSNGADLPLVAKWTGSTMVAIPAPHSVGASLYGVSCASTSNCMAVGRDGHATYAAQWTGHAWRLTHPPSPVTPNGDILMSVSCLAATNCWAVGYTDGATPNMHVLIGHWYAGRWTRVPAPSPPASVLNSVSCASTSDCWAMGGQNVYHTTGTFATLIEHWNGRTWTLIHTPSTSGVVNAVSCTSTATCWAVGGTQNGSLAMRLVGGRWHLLLVPHQLGFESVGCPNSRECWIGGNGGADLWSDAQFLPAATSQPPLSVNFVAVGCPSPSECLFFGATLPKIGSGGKGPFHAVVDVSRPN